MNKNKKRLEKTLQDMGVVLPDGEASNEILLKAFGCYHAQEPGTEISEKFNLELEENSLFFSAGQEEFRKFKDLGSFICAVLPDVVLQKTPFPVRVSQLFRSNICKSVVNILVIKRLVETDFSGRVKEWTDVETLGRIKTQVFAKYLDLMNDESEDDILDEETFWELYFATAAFKCNLGVKQFFSLRQSELKSIITAVEAIKNDLAMSREDQAKFLESIICCNGKKHLEGLWSSQSRGRFSHLSLEEAKAVYDKKISGLNDKQPLDVSKTMDIVLRDPERGLERLADSLIAELSIEGNIILSYWLGELMNLQDGEEALILGATSFFVEAFVKNCDNLQINRKITLAVNAETEVVLYKNWLGKRWRVFNVINRSKLNAVENFVNVKCVLIFDTEKGCREIFPVLKALTPDTRILYYGTDANLSAAGSFTKDFCGEGYGVERVILLRKGIIPKSKRNKSRLRMLWFGSLERPNAGSQVGYLKRCTVPGEDNCAYFYIEDSSTSAIDLNHVIKEGVSLREYLLKSEIKESRHTEIKKGTVVNYTPELQILYTLQKGRNGKQRVVAVLLNPETNVAVQESRRDRTMLPEAVEKYVREEYINEECAPRYEADGIALIKDLAESQFASFFFAKPICLKTALVIYFRSFYLTRTEKEREILDLFANSSIGERPLDLVTVEDYYNAFDGLFPDSSKENNFRCLIVFDALLDWCCEFEHLRSNFIKPELSEITRSQRAMRYFKSAFTKKSFTEKEFTALYKECMQKLKSHKLAYLAVLIRLLTGLESNVIAALKWSDYLVDTNYKLATLAVYKQLANKAGDIKYLKDKEIRLIPCSSLLAEEIDRAKKKVPAESLKNGYIIADPRSGDYSVPIDPNEITRLCKACVETLEIEDELVTVPDDLEGTIETNPSRYLGDIFKENAKYWTKFLCNLTSDESSVMFGYQRVTTMGTNYTDFCNEKTLKELARKLDRLTPFLVTNYCNISNKKSVPGFLPASISVESCQKDRVMLLLNFELPDDKTKFVVSSDCGIKFRVVEENR